MQSCRCVVKCYEFLLDLIFCGVGLSDFRNIIKNERRYSKRSRHLLLYIIFIEKKFPMKDTFIYFPLLPLNHSLNFNKTIIKIYIVYSYLYYHYVKVSQTDSREINAELTVLNRNISPKHFMKLLNANFTERALVQPKVTVLTVMKSCHQTQKMFKLDRVEYFYY